MDSKVATVTLRKLRPAADRSEFELHQLALEYSLDVPLSVRSKKDIESARRWRDRLEPYAHQIKNLITFCRRAPVVLFADDVGLGKTISAGLVLSELIARKKVQRTLIVAPGILLENWKRELDSRFAIQADYGTGAALRDALVGPKPTVITTYHSLKNVKDAIEHAGFDMLILDEAHKLRNLHGRTKKPVFAQVVQHAISKRQFKYVLMLTATPIQNRLWDLYSLIDLMATAKGHENPLGCPRRFASRYLEDRQRAVKLRESEAQEFRRHLARYIVRTRRSDSQLIFPDRIVNTHKAKPSATEQGLLDVVRDIFMSIKAMCGPRRGNHLVQISLGQALMSSPQALLAQVQNMATRPFAKAAPAYRDMMQIYAARVADLVPPGTRSSKIRLLDRLVQKLRSERPEDWKVVVFTGRSETQRALAEHFETVGILSTVLVTGGQRRANQLSIDRFTKRRKGANILISTDAGSEGVNLQVANVLVNFDLPWNPMVIEQRIGRIQRLKSDHANVYVLNLVLKDSIEDLVVERLLGKLMAISQSVGDVEGILSCAATEGHDDLDYEGLIRELVVGSLQGQDVAETVERERRSIEQAKKVFAKEQSTVEATLGNLGNLHREGPRYPVITAPRPSFGPKEFTRRSFRHEGALVEHIDKNIDAVIEPNGRRYLVSHAPEQPQPAEVAPPTWHYPGSPPFERRVQRWSGQSEAFVVDRRLPSDDMIVQELYAWISRYSGIAVTTAQVAERRPAFRGEVTVKASAAHTTDSLERLIQVQVSPSWPDDLEQPGETERRLSAELDLTQCQQDIETPVSDSVLADPDIMRFVDFYSARRDEELLRAKSEEQRTHVRDQLDPVLTATLVSAHGVLVSTVRVTAQISIDGRGAYPLDFRAFATADGRVSIESDTRWRECEESGRYVPSSVLGTCAVTGRVVQDHLLRKSSVGEKKALRRVMEACEVTGALVLPEQLATCCVTGKRVLTGLVAESAVSGNTCIKEKLQQCALTGAQCLPSELCISEVSGKQYRADEGAVCAVTGMQGHKSEFAECEFTGAMCAPASLLVSEVSGKQYRADQSQRSSQSVRTGHESEFCDSNDPMGCVALDEAGQSDVSGGIGALARMIRSSREPGRLGFASEAVTCDVTHNTLLVDEVGHSSVSGLLVNDRLLLRSAASGRSALRNEMVRCSVSAAWLLPDEVSICGLTGEPVDSRLLKASGVSGRVARIDRMVLCEETQKLVLPDESAVCKITGRKVCKYQLATCAITGRQVIRRLMRRCPTTLEYFTTDATAQEETWRTCGTRKLLTRCQWTGRVILSQCVGRCELTGVWVRSTLLNEQGELSTCRALLDGRPVQGEEELLCDTLDWLRAQSAELQGVVAGRGIRSANPNERTLVIAAAEIKPHRFSSARQWAGLAFRTGQNPVLLRKPVIGRRTEAGWLRTNGL